MKYFKFLLLPVLVISISSCAGDNVNTEEKTEIEIMDSTAKAISDTTDKLESQTEKVEASLEKLNEEFNNNN